MEVNNQVSITMTLAQGEYCESNNLDPESPLCAHSIVTGELVKLTPGSEAVLKQIMNCKWSI